MGPIWAPLVREHVIGGWGPGWRRQLFFSYKLSRYVVDDHMLRVVTKRFSSGLISLSAFNVISSLYLRRRSKMHPLTNYNSDHIWWQSQSSCKSDSDTWGSPGIMYYDQIWGKGVCIRMLLVSLFICKLCRQFQIIWMYCENCFISIVLKELWINASL